METLASELPTRPAAADAVNRRLQLAPAITAAAISFLFAEVGCQMSHETAHLQRARRQAGLTACSAPPAGV